MMKNCFYKCVFVLVLVLSLFDPAQAQIIATISANATTCGLPNGTAEVYPSNGTGYVYQWSNGGSTTDTISALAPGNYSVTVYNTANAADSIVKTFNIPASSPVTLTATATRDSICQGSSDVLTVSGAASGTYTWSGGTLTSPVTGSSITISSISSNVTTYTYTVTWGTNACASATYTITSYPVNATLQTTVQPSCGHNNGAINCSVGAGANFQTTLLLNGAVIQRGSQTQFQNLAPGTYTFIVSDAASGCTDTLPAIVLADNTQHPIISNVSISPESCFGNKNGSINVTVDSCQGGCTFSWSQGGNTTDSAIHLAAGTYTFSVSEGGCSNIDTVIVVPGPAFALTDTLRAHDDHCSHTVGSAIVLSGGGTGPYSYVWSMGTQLGDSVSGMAGDSTVYVTVTDSHGCKDTLHAYIGNSSGPNGYLNRPDTICGTERNGILIATTTTHDGPFTFAWSNGQSTNVNAGVPAGPYSVTITDAVGCDTILHDTIPAYIPSHAYTVSPGTSISLGQTVEVVLMPNVPVTNVEWNPYIPGSTGSTVVSFKPQKSQGYNIVITYGSSCTITDTLVIDVRTDSTKWSIPNTFTPNGDGINDFFKLINFPELTSFHIWIFDRWGNKVYESTDPDFQWNGLDGYAGNKSPNTGVFSYAIEYQELNADSKGTIGGNISLVK